MITAKRKFIILFFTGLFGAIDISINASSYAVEVGTMGVSLAFGMTIGGAVWAGYEMYLGFAGVEVDEYV